MVYFACGLGKLITDRLVNMETKEVLVYDTDDFTYEVTDGKTLLELADEKPNLFKPYYDKATKTIEVCDSLVVKHSDICLYRYKNTMVITTQVGVSVIYLKDSVLYINTDIVAKNVSFVSNPYRDKGKLILRIVVDNTNIHLDMDKYLNNSDFMLDGIESEDNDIELSNLLGRLEVVC